MITACHERVEYIVIFMSQPVISLKPFLLNEPNRFLQIK